MKKSIIMTAFVSFAVLSSLSTFARKWFADTRAKVSNVFSRRKSPSANLRELGKRPDMGSDLGKKLFKGYSDIYQRGRKSAVEMGEYKAGRKLTPQEKVKARIKYEKKMHWDPVKGNWRHNL